MVGLRAVAATLLLAAAISPVHAQETLKPVVAGLFYPADKKTLQETVDRFLKGAPQPSQGTVRVVGLMSPHAGYEYSGKVAGTAYRRIQGRPVGTVIVLAPSHQAAFRGAAILPSGAMETPLGTIPVDERMAARIMERCSFVRPYPPAFAREHSLEVQLPFLQRALRSFKIVPVVMGRMGGSELKGLAETLAAISEASSDTLIVASSDMSHFHPYAEASRMDEEALRLIEGVDHRALASRLESGSVELCGALPVLTLMMVTERMGGEARTLEYANSGDVTKDRSRVVGYGAALFTVAQDDSRLGQAEQKILLTLARRTLEAQVSGVKTPPAPTDNRKLQEKRPVFVTLTKGGALRGCIGTVAPVLPLSRAVQEMTVSSCSQDPRFVPVSFGEVKALRIEISVLSPMRLVKDASEVKTGKHGLMIIKGRRSGLLLPQVAVEQGWDREEFLRQVCVKAGLPVTAWQDGDAQLYLFSAQVFSE